MSDDDPDAIWRSDDVPVPPAPAETGAFTDRGPATGEITFETLTDEHGDSTPRRLGPASMIVGAVIATAFAVAAVVALVVNSSEESTAPTATDPGASAVDTIADTIERTDAPTTTTATRTATTTTIDAVESVPEQIELPAAVAAIGAPTEVIGLTPSGQLHTVSLPSGRVRSVDLASASDSSVANGFSSLVVTPDSAAIGTGGSTMVVVPRSGDAIDVELDVSADSGGTNVEGWIRGDDDAVRFVVASYPTAGGDVELFAVTADGDSVELPERLVEYRFGPAAALQGELIVNDAGGAYRVASDGTSQRIENGVVYAYDERHRLVRECDATQQCSTVLVTEADGARRVIDPAVFPDDVREITYGTILSPDGSAAAMLRSGTSQQQRVIVDFDVGEVAAAPSDTWLVGSTWAADSSGVFDVAQGELQFIDRATGEAVAFGRELGPFVTIGVRHPDAELPAEPAVVTTVLTAQQPIDPTGLVVSVAGRSGDIGVLTVDSLELTTWKSPALGRGPAVVVASGDAVLALPADDSPAFLTTPTGDTTLGESFATNAPMLVGPSDDTVWVAADTATPTDLDYRLLRLDGTLAEDLGNAVVDLDDATLLGSDGRGALVVERRGDLFVVGVDGAVRLTSGELIAIGATTAYVRECESVVDCAVVRIDRASDTRVPVLNEGVLLESLGAVNSSRGPALGSTVSPDGDVFVSRLAALNGGLEPTMQTVLVDISTGTATFVDGQVDDQPLVWNADSTFAALLVGPNIEVYDRAGDRSIALDGARVRAIGPAPRPPTPAG